MNTTDPIADMLTRIRNANTSKHKTVDVPASKMKVGIAEILFREGYNAYNRNDHDTAIEKLTKVYTKWDYEGCMKGNVGDILCFPENDTDDIYVIKREVFELTYEKI